MAGMQNIGGRAGLSTEVTVSIRTTNKAIYGVLNGKMLPFIVRGGGEEETVLRRSVLGRTPSFLFHKARRRA